MSLRPPTGPGRRLLSPLCVPGTASQLRFAPSALVGPQVPLPGLGSSGPDLHFALAARRHSIVLPGASPLQALRTGPVRRPAGCRTAPRPLPRAAVRVPGVSGFSPFRHTSNCSMILRSWSLTHPASSQRSRSSCVISRRVVAKQRTPRLYSPRNALAISCSVTLTYAPARFELILSVSFFSLSSLPRSAFRRLVRLGELCRPVSVCPPSLSLPVRSPTIATPGITVPLTIRDSIGYAPSGSLFGIMFFPHACSGRRDNCPSRDYSPISIGSASPALSTPHIMVSPSIRSIHPPQVTSKIVRSTLIASGLLCACVPLCSPGSSFCPSSSPVECVSPPASSSPSSW